MSASNRGTERAPNDNYQTPMTAITPLFYHFTLRGGKNILEPCAGDGNIIRAVRGIAPTAYITGIEIDKGHAEALAQSQPDRLYFMDFLNYYPNEPIDTIISNPPFSLAEKIIKHSFEIAPEAEVIMLLRTAFMEAYCRRDFWKHYPVTQLYTLEKRPSFRGKGTDATSYSWFVWSEYREKDIKTIYLED